MLNLCSSALTGNGASTEKPLSLSLSLYLSIYLSLFLGRPALDHTRDAIDDNTLKKLVDLLSVRVTRFKSLGN